MNKNKINFNSSISTPIAEKLKMIPGVFGIRLGEKPEFQLLQSEADKEIRRYGPLTLASVTMCGESHDEAKRVAISCLMDYIFGKNENEQLIAPTGMFLQQEIHCQPTSPVLQKQNFKRLMVSMVLPKNCNLAMAPAPLDKRLILHEKAGHLVGVIQYSGTNISTKIEKHTCELNEWLNQHEVYYPANEIYLVEYDNPVTLPFLRKNEIHIEVADRH